MILSLKTLKIVAAALALLVGTAASATDTGTVIDDVIKVTILGTGTPIPTPDQFGPSVLVQAGGKNLLFDCGRGCTTRLAQVDRKLVSGIEHLFVTHLHSDHIVGIDDLWLNGWTQGRNSPLKVAGPTGTKRFFKYLREAFNEDINIRIKKGLPATTDGIGMAMTDLSDDRIVFDEDGVIVTAFLVDHRPVEPAFGFRVDFAGRSVVISGDTTPSPNLVKHAAGADVVIHEVMSPSQIGYVRDKFTDSQFKAIVGIHTTAEEAGKIFAEISPRLAVYYHTRNTVSDVSSLISETRKYYQGPLEISRDLMQITIADEIKLKWVE